MLNRLKFAKKMKHVGLNAQRAGRSLSVALLTFGAALDKDDNSKAAKLRSASLLSTGKKRHYLARASARVCPQ